MTAKKLLLLCTGILFIVGAGLCVAMSVSAVKFLEWGRVVLYSVCLAVCVEASVLCLTQMKGKKQDS